MTRRIGFIPSVASLQRNFDDLLRRTAAAKLLLTVAQEIERIPQRSIGEIERELSAEIANAGQPNRDVAEIIMGITKDGK